VAAGGGVCCASHQSLFYIKLCSAKSAMAVSIIAIFTLKPYVTPSPLNNSDVPLLSTEYLDENGCILDTCARPLVIRSAPWRPVLWTLHQLDFSYYFCHIQRVADRTRRPSHLFKPECACWANLGLKFVKLSIIGLMNVALDQCCPARFFYFSTQPGSARLTAPISRSAHRPPGPYTRLVC